MSTDQPGTSELADRLESIARRRRPFNVTITDANDIMAAAVILRAAAERGAYQQRVHAWVVSTFNTATAFDPVERCHRFGEEAIELLQAANCSRADVLTLVDYVYRRPVGAVAQEVGGVMNTLAALCTALGVRLDDAAEAELARCYANSERIRAKWLTKPKGSPLPGTAPAEVAPC